MARAEPQASYLGALVSVALQISPPCGQGVLNFGDVCAMQVLKRCSVCAKEVQG